MYSPGCPQVHKIHPPLPPKYHHLCYYFLCVGVFYTYVCALSIWLVTLEDRTGPKIGITCAMWVLGVEPRSSRKEVNAFLKLIN